jgi:hypothetical protein
MSVFSLELKQRTTKEIYNATISKVFLSPSEQLVHPNLQQNSGLQQAREPMPAPYSPMTECEQMSLEFTLQGMQQAAFCK